MEIIDFDTQSQASLLSEKSERENVKESDEQAASSDSLAPHAAARAEKEETLSWGAGWSGEGSSDGGGAGTRLLSTSSSLPLLDEMESMSRESMGTGTLGDAAGRKAKSASGPGLGKRLGRKRNTVYPAQASFTAELDPHVKPARTVDMDIDEPLIAADTKQQKLKGPPMFGRSNVLVAPAQLSEGATEQVSGPSTSVSWAEGRGDGQGLDKGPHPNPKKKILPFGLERSRVAPSDALVEESPKPLDSSVFMGESAHAVEETTGEKRILAPKEMEQGLKKRLSMPSLSPSVPQAYIPISFAKEAIDTVVFDMKKMRNDHVHVVAKIREAYEEIEEDTKAQYMKFVLHLKEEHASKVSIYKQVIQILQEELNKTREHWEGTSMSLENQNRELLQENKELYKKIKDTLALAEKEKEKTISELSKVLDDERKCNTEDSKKHQLEIETLQAKHSQEVHSFHKKLKKEPAKLKSKKNVVGQEMIKQQEQLQPQEQENKLLEQPKIDLIQGTNEQMKSSSQPDSLERELLDSQLKREVQSTQEELGQLQKRLNDLISIFESELSLHTALATTFTQLNSNVDSLDNEMRELESNINKWEMEFKDGHNNAMPTESDWPESIAQQHSKLQDLTLEFDRQKYKLQVLQKFQEMGTFSEDLFSHALEPEIEQAATEVQSSSEPQQTIAVKESDHDETIKLEDVVPAKPSQKAVAPVKQVKTTSAADPKSMQELKRLKEQVAELKKKHEGDSAKIKSLEKELQASSKSAGGSIEDKKELKKKEKEFKDLSRQYEIAKKNLDKTQSQLKAMDVQLTELKKENENLKEESKRLTQELQKLSISAKQGKDAEEKLKTMEQQVKSQADELKVLAENYNSERVLRKKYYNIIEDMKGKIRVYCRARPLSSSELARNNFSVIESPDEYTVRVKTSRGIKEFQFDQMFVPEHPQTKVFEDTKNLIQSAVDGYNVCIFAYGQTGSGKTYTMIGGRDSNNELTAPGIAPRAFETIFELIESNRKKFTFTVSCYMLELYNDRLLDLFQSSTRDPQKLDIKKDKKGLVYVQGATTNIAESSAALMELFELGSKNRHIASTKMNAESSRSHLIIGIVLESTNLSTGTVHKGKLSLVDLAGSERAAKTGATAEQLKEAQSINKSLSALGDVISALSSGQEFVPYRNNKLTLLMQDSLGGNAKTLMFVNISPADYNTDETVVSLTYAARVKLITNDASKNAENKEIARLKGIIAKLKKGEAIDEEL